MNNDETIMISDGYENIVDVNSLIIKPKKNKKKQYETSSFYDDTEISTKDFGTCVIFAYGGNMIRITSTKLISFEYQIESCTLNFMIQIDISDYSNVLKIAKTIINNSLNESLEDMVVFQNFYLDNKVILKENAHKSEVKEFKILENLILSMTIKL